MKLYDWQKKFIEHNGNATLRGTRQGGKSWAEAYRIKRLMDDYPGSRSLLIAPTGRQSNYLYEKVCELIGANYKGRKTLAKVQQKNGSILFRFDVGRTGVFVEGLSSIDFLHADEAIYMGEKVWDSILPMLAEPAKRGLGWISMLSSTRGNPKGFFYDSFSRKDFLKIQIKAEECGHIGKEFLEAEKLRLGERFYNVIYNGEFDEEANKYFNPDLIKAAVKIGIWEYKKDYSKSNYYYLGIDPARFGKSKAGFAVMEAKGKYFNIIHGEEIQKTSLMELKRRTDYLENLFKFIKIYIDSGGFGAGLIDILTEETIYKRKIIDINNSARGEEGKILKEDIYSNFLKLLEQNKIILLNDEKIIDGLLKVEFDDEGKIIGTDMSEAIMRAVWGSKERNKKIALRLF